MTNRTEFCTMNNKAQSIADSANLVYWLSSEAVERRDSANYHERYMHEQFADLAKLMGYRIEKIEPVEVVSGADFRGETPALQSAVQS